MTITLTVSAHVAELLMRLAQRAPEGVTLATVAQIALARGVEVVASEVISDVNTMV